MRQVDLVSGWADRFTVTGRDRLAEVVGRTVGQLGRRAGVDAVVLSHGGLGPEPAWAADGRERPPLGLLRESRTPWTAARLRAGGEVVVDRVDGLIGAAAVDRRMLQAAGVGACLAVPLHDADAVVAALVLVDAGPTRAWTTDEIEQARAAARRLEASIGQIRADEDAAPRQGLHAVPEPEPEPSARAATPHRDGAASADDAPRTRAGSEGEDDVGVAAGGGAAGAAASGGPPGSRDGGGEDPRDIRDAVFAGMRDGVVVVDRDGRVVDANPAAERLLGRPREALLGIDLRELHAEEDRDAYWNRFLESARAADETIRSTVFVRPDGTRLLAEAATTTIDLDGRELVQSTFHPLGDGATMRERLLELAYVDPVTGLGNRAALHRFLEPLVEAAAGDGEPVAVAFLDLDRFKPVNDLLGHEAGDHALRLLGGRLGASLAASTPAGGRPRQVFRLAGDEFVAVLPGADAAGARGAVARLAAELDEPLDVDGRPVLLPASIGVASAPKHGASPRELLRAADTAMYAAKRSPRAWVVYERSFALAEQAERDLEEGLRLAIRDGAVDVGFVVQAGLHDGAVEALVAVPRWPDRSGLDLDHREVLRLADRAGAGPELETLVLARALRAAASWPTGLGAPRLWLPVRGATLAHVDLAGRIRAALGQTGLRFDRIALELQEAEPLRASGVRDGLRALRRSGVELALSDRRTSFAAVAAALEVGLDHTVIDVAAGLGTSTPAGWSRLFAATAVAGSRAGLPTVAGGVDDEAALHAAIDLGATSVRGGWLGPPLDVPATWALVRALRDAG